ncbi:hypothetical protein [Levilactobacillus brevis]|uniref:hypothetical protein n=1 Tax=Levilactobacillus brevis TaxID=1580 RepID=UPI0020731467|nr:hypothetical protein [Levilactobacillus brevis]MCM6797094.1 hypothetical protein [Levilactobacillus brevis]
MKKLTHKYAAALMLLGVVAGMELAAGTTTASAKTSNTSPWEYGKTGKYAWSAPKDDAAPLYYTNTKKNGYIWNKIFTKKLHNIKNYQYTSWYAQEYAISNLLHSVLVYLIINIIANDTQTNSCLSIRPSELYQSYSFLIC